MKISINDVEHVANLARLELSDEEKAMYTDQLGKILEYAEKLQELQVTDVPPTSHVLPIKNVLRDDVRHESLSNETALANAPDHEDGQFRVPAVLEG